MRRIFVHALGVAALIATVPAFAQDKGAARKACAADYQKYCANVALGDGRVKKCLSEHLDVLAPDCRVAVLAFTGAQDGARQAGSGESEPSPPPKK
jgi:hypothetical protein